ncbi:permease-like cell division protein FtsX [Solwaraspora sp. WMMD791]|uniref:permease-like cell division protein FtsX n=1 Tax=Solwaraspora sp. WMMD791 TaxID=3016086 RepID=UPI00249A85DB|nr:permease-like cell division protein FtsX [Solwaraspora sp. WMMD791]WFE30146.1 permease-like cell division protein FtsX [Solwaraspora sp. WMMD791]
MDQLRTHFEQAFDGEPPPATPGEELARAAMAGGARLRRRRRLTIGGAAVAVTALAAVAAGLAVPVRDAPAPIPAPAAMGPMGSGICAATTADDPATEVAVFLDAQVTDEQRAAIDVALRADPRLSTVRYESRQQAYDRFRELYRNPSPGHVVAESDLVEQVTVDQFPESFRLTLVDPNTYPQMELTLRALPGVDDVISSFCPPRATQREGE